MFMLNKMAAMFIFVSENSCVLAENSLKFAKNVPLTIR